LGACGRPLLPDESLRLPLGFSLSGFWAPAGSAGVAVSGVVSSLGRWFSPVGLESTAFRLAPALGELEVFEESSVPAAWVLPGFWAEAPLEEGSDEVSDSMRLKMSAHLRSTESGSSLNLSYMSATSHSFPGNSSARRLDVSSGTVDTPLPYVF